MVGGHFMLDMNAIVSPVKVSISLYNKLAWRGIFKSSVLAPDEKFNGFLDDST